MSTERPRRAPVDDGLFIIGLVGRAGSGKSTVARALVEQGARLIEADAIGHEVTDRDPEVRAALAAEYGPDIYLADGTLDRRRVATRVFADPAARARLDRRVHPRIVAEIRKRLEALRSARFRGFVVVDAALMLEWGLERECDVVVTVFAKEAEQVGRLVHSRGWSDAEARARLATQRTNESFIAAADMALENSGREEELRARAVEALERLRKSGGSG